MTGRHTMPGADAAPSGPWVEDMAGAICSVVFKMAPSRGRVRSFRTCPIHTLEDFDTWPAELDGDILDAIATNGMVAAEIFSALKTKHLIARALGAQVNVWRIDLAPLLEQATVG